MNGEAAGRIARSYRLACAWDVAARKPGNVSLASAGHRMQATQFLQSAQVSAAAIAEDGAPVGQRVLAAVRATWDSVGCNTNLGIVLLAAPLAASAQHPGALGDATALQSAWASVMRALSVADAQAAFDAIALAQPAGLGRARQADVFQPARLTLREAMALAAPRDRIARQYADEPPELWALGLPALHQAMAQHGVVAWGSPSEAAAAEHAACEACVQTLYLSWLASAPDSHIVRKWGEAVAHTVMAEAKPWAQRAARGEHLSIDTEFAVWDESLKARGLNPGSSADLTVATLMLAVLASA